MFWSILILHYNELYHLKHCINSITQQNIPFTYEIIICCSIKQQINSKKIESKNIIIHEYDNIHLCNITNSIEKCNGKWIHILRDIDYLNNNFFKTINKYNNIDANFINCQYITCNDNYKWIDICHHHS